MGPLKLWSYTSAPPYRSHCTGSYHSYKRCNSCNNYNNKEQAANVTLRPGRKVAGEKPPTPASPAIAYSSNRQRLGSDAGDYNSDELSASRTFGELIVDKREFKSGVELSRVRPDQTPLPLSSSPWVTGKRRHTRRPTVIAVIIIIIKNKQPM